MTAAPYDQDPGPDGLVVIESEHADENIPRGGYSWVADFTAGYSGDADMLAFPTSGGGQKVPGYSLTSPQLGYQVDFLQTGTYYVWLRAIAPFSSSNSVHVGLDGAEVPSSENIYVDVGSAWIWANGLTPASFEVTTTGVHTINVWMRESGFKLDKLLITKNPAYVPTGLEPESTRGGGGFQDDFADGNAVGWTEIDSCVLGASDWQVVSEVYRQVGDCRGFSPEGVALGTLSLAGAALPADVDIQLQVRAEDPDTDAIVSNDGSSNQFGAMGLVFGYQDGDNFYRVDLNGNNGHRKLWRKQGGTYTELVTSPQSYVRGQWVNLRVVRANGVILVWVDGQLALTAADATFSGGQMGLFCDRNASCSFDNVVVTAAPTDALLGMNLPDGSGHASAEYFVTSGNTLDVSGYATQAVGGVEFVVDEGQAGEMSQSDTVAPYSKQFTLTPGNHSLTAYLLDGSAVRVPGSAVSWPQIGMGGIVVGGVGDSITAGVKDNQWADDSFGPNTGGGYAPLLNQYLSASNAMPVTVLNEGNPGEESWEGADRIQALIARTPSVQAYLALYGANDSSGGSPTPDGLGLSCTNVVTFTGCDAGYLGSFKYNLQRVLNAGAAAGKTVFLGKTSPHLLNATRDALIQVYNQVVDQLVTENGLGYVPADFHSYFTAHPGEFDADGLHPAGPGYVSMGRLWCTMLNGKMGLLCTPS